MLQTIKTITVKWHFKPLFIKLIILSLFSYQASGQQSPQKGKGFVKIFDGKTLKGWEGDPKYWRVENGALVGEVTPETIVKRNSFIIWRGGEVADFELTVKYRISDKGNSGINYRSIELDSIPFAMKGYQADIDGPGRYGDGFSKHTGQNYEERGRKFLAIRGQQVLLETGAEKPTITSSLGDNKELASHIKKDAWNKYRLVVKGNNMKHYINGVLMSEVTDHDIKNQTFKGLLGVQVHVGPPMKVEYRNFRLKSI
jgi:hypothetical protein